MPNVTEEFLDLQGLQSYDAKIKEVIAAAAGGDSVQWTQSVLSGTKIAEITINGTTQNIYIPSLPQAESEVV